MKRIVVVGISGAGKTTLARELSMRLGLPHVELDSIAHRRGFESTPRSQFISEVSEAASRPEWVIDGNYTSWGTMETLWPRADTFVWLDLPKSVVMRRVLRRTLGRVVRREVLWDGARERWANLFDPHPDNNIVLWTWARHASTREKFESATADGKWSHATIHRLRSDEDVRRLLSSLEH